MVNYKGSLQRNCDCLLLFLIKLAKEGKTILDKCDPTAKFNALKTEWDTATAHLSSITEIAMHPAYQQIIGMGQVAIPLILSEMGKKPDHWFWALRSITGEDPVLPEHRGRLKQMTEDWLKWGKKHSYAYR